MKRWVKNTKNTILCLIPIGLIVGFSNDWSNRAPISCVGSSGVKPFVEAMSKEYMKTNSKVDITVEAGGSGFGIEQIAKGFTNIGNASKDPYSAVRGDDNGVGGFRQQWIDRNIKTVTIGWEAICNVFIPPKGLNPSLTNYNPINENNPININNLLSINDNNIARFYRIFSGWSDGVWSTDTDLPKNSMWYFVSDNAKEYISTHNLSNDEEILKHTLITPYVRAGGSLTSGTASSFINSSNLQFDKNSDLDAKKRKAFESGYYGTSFGIQQTDEANSRAWDIFNKSNNSGQVVYLSSGFIEQNESLIKEKGYGKIAYNGTPYSIDKVNEDDGYNWFRPLNTLISIPQNQNSNEIHFLEYILAHPDKLEALGAKELQEEEITQMFPGMINIDNLGTWHSDYELSTNEEIDNNTMHDPNDWDNWNSNWWFAPIAIHQQEP